MDVVNEERTPVTEENNTIEETSKSADYPSACLLLDSCIQAYQRLQENYNRIYDKINVALAFAGVVLTIMLGSFDFELDSFCMKDMTAFALIMTSVKLLCLVGGVGLTLFSTIYLLILMRG